MQIVKKQDIITKTIYVSSDGNEFSSERQCLKYERQLEIKKHPMFAKCITLDSFDNSRNITLYYLSNKDDYFFLKEVYNTSFYWESDFANHGEGWYVFYEEDPETCCLYNYDNYVKEFENWKADVEEAMKKMR